MPSLLPFLLRLLLLLLIPSATAGGQQIFGIGAELNSEKACLSLMLIIVFTVAFEVGTLRIQQRLNGTPFLEMVNKIYAELTILGLISFGVFLTLQSGILDSPSELSWLYAFEFSHIVIFFAALMFVLSACFMMATNRTIKVHIDRAAAKSSGQCIAAFNAGNGDKRGGLLPSTAASELEFKMYNMHFVTLHKLPVSAFDFGMYMREVLDEHVVDLIEVEISSWIILIIALGVNIFMMEILGLGANDDPVAVAGARRLRNAVGRALGEAATASCGRRLGETATDCYRRYLGETATEEGAACGCCEEETASEIDDGHRRAGGVVDPCATPGGDGMEYALMLGWLLVLVTGILLVLYRRSEIKIRKVLGCNTLEEAGTYIKAQEDELLAEEARLLKIHEAAVAKKKADGEAAGIHHTNSAFGHGQNLIGAMKAGHGEDDLYEEGGGGHVAHAHFHEHDPVKGDHLLNEVGAAVLGLARGTSSLTGMHPGTSKVSALQESEHPNAVPVSEEEGAVVAPEQQFARSVTFTEMRESSNLIKVKLSAIAALVQWRYKKLLDMIMLFNCFYLAVFGANYALIALREDHLPWLWFFALLTPGFLTLWVCGKIIRVQAIIGAVCNINLETIDKVINETQELYETGKEIFQQFRAKLDFLGIKSKDLAEEFGVMDKDGSGDLNEAEFRQSLAALGVHLTGGKAKKLFRICDEDRSGSITFDELFKLVFPEENKAGELVSPRGQKGVLI